MYVHNAAVDCQTEIVEVKGNQCNGWCGIVVKTTRVYLCLITISINFSSVSCKVLVHCSVRMGQNHQTRQHSQSLMENGSESSNKTA